MIAVVYFHKTVLIQMSVSTVRKHKVAQSTF